MATTALQSEISPLCSIRNNTDYGLLLQRTACGVVAVVLIVICKVEAQLNFFSFIFWNLSDFNSNLVLCESLCWSDYVFLISLSGYIVLFGLHIS